MTLTHILPTLRASIPHPMSRDRWPEFTTTSPSDVTVAGVSMTRLADWCGTPCVHTAAAVIPGTNGAPSPTEMTSVIVTRVREISRAHDGSLDIWIDARLADCDAHTAQIRLIGRVSTASDQTARIHTAGLHVPSVVVSEIVSDLQVGDLFALPCSGTVRLCEIDPEHHHLDSRVSDTDTESDDWSPILCRR